MRLNNLSLDYGNSKIRNLRDNNDPVQIQSIVGSVQGVSEYIAGYLRGCIFLDPGSVFTLESNVCTQTKRRGVGPRTPTAASTI
jgi:hypothetical protein